MPEKIFAVLHVYIYVYMCNSMLSRTSFLTFFVRKEKEKPAQIHGVKFDPERIFQVTEGCMAKYDSNTCFSKFTSKTCTANYEPNHWPYLQISQTVIKILFSYFVWTLIQRKQNTTISD